MFSDFSARGCAHRPMIPAMRPTTTTKPARMDRSFSSPGSSGHYTERKDCKGSSQSLHPGVAGGRSHGDNPVPEGATDMGMLVSRRRVLQMAMVPAFFARAEAGAQDLAPVASRVYPGADGRLAYVPDDLGNSIHDASHAGYRGGGVT